MESRITLFIDEEEMSDQVYIEELDSGFYRLKEHPTFSELTKYDDIVELEKVSDNIFNFIRVVKPSKLEKAEFILSAQDENKKKLKDILQRVMDSGGYWQRDFGGLLFLFFESSIYNPIDDVYSALTIE